MREDREPEPSGEEGLADLRVLDAIRRSAETGRVEPVHGVERRKHPAAGQGVERSPHEMPSLVRVEAPGKD